MKKSLYKKIIYLIYLSNTTGRVVSRRNKGIGPAKIRTIAIYSREHTVCKNEIEKLIRLEILVHSNVISYTFHFDFSNYLQEELNSLNENKYWFDSDDNSYSRFSIFGNGLQYIALDYLIDRSSPKIALTHLLEFWEFIASKNCSRELKATIISIIASTKSILQR